MTSKICLSIEDGYADVYALHTLYTYLIENNFQADFKAYALQVEHLLRFNKCIKESGVGEEFKSDRVMLVDERERWPDIILGGYSDANNNLAAFPERTILIDHSILKNCVKPTTKEQKSELRKKYNIAEDKPMTVIGFPSLALGCDKPLENILKEISKNSSVYLVGTVRFQDFDRDKVKSLATIVDETGVLKDYYAMADAAMMHRNICPVDALYHLHNFVEATAGGPLFLVKPSNTAQYGYSQLKDANVIREAESTEDLISKVKKYLQNIEEFEKPSENSQTPHNSALDADVKKGYSKPYPDEEKVREQRTRHLEQSRNRYLPDILRLINKVIGKSDEPFQSDLLAEILPPKIPYLSRVYSPRIAVCHPQTLWDLSQTKPLIPLRDIPKKVYKSFRMKK